MSTGASTVASTARRSVAHIGLLRQRLRVSGALPSSRSIVSRHEEPADEDVIDVGEGQRANVVEHLLARLEQHGLRRCFCANEPTSVYGVTPEVQAFEAKAEPENEPAPCPASSDDARPAEWRAAYYYCCVPCELRLTPVSSSAATFHMLQDAHHHVSSAAHRRAAALMGDPDIDATLLATPVVEQPQSYARVFVNGIPTLLSRRPGGGDLFYPLPFEEDACGYHMDGDLVGAFVEPPVEGEDHLCLYPDGTPRPRVLPANVAKADAVSGVRPCPTFWYNPTESLFTHTRQVPHLDHLARDHTSWHLCGLRHHLARSRLAVQHVPLTLYRSAAGVDPSMVPLEPQVFGLTPRLLRSTVTRKRRRGEAEPGACAVSLLPVYVQALAPVETCIASTSPGLQRCVVHTDGAYRVALVADAPSVGMRKRTASPQEGSWSADGSHSRRACDASTSTPLTEEALRLHAAAFAAAEPVGGPRGGADTSYFSLPSRSQETASDFGTSISVDTDDYSDTSSG